jgi:hypothetical protein
MADEASGAPEQVGLLWNWRRGATLPPNAPPSEFWIIHHVANIASQRGIARAGFQIACSVYRMATGALTYGAADGLRFT